MKFRQISQSERGTAVSFNIPVQAVVTPALPAETESQDAFTPPQLENLRVLIVDDSVVNRMVVSQLLRNRLPDVTIQEADDGLEAVNAVTDAEFDLILKDILMPKLNGIEATLQIKAVGQTTPIIGLTADISEAVARDAMTAGMFALLTKPFSHSELLATMTSAIKQPAVEATGPSEPDGAAHAQSTSGPLTESFRRRWEKRIQAFVESSSHSLFGLVFWAGAFVCALYAVMAPDARLQLIYVGMCVISLVLALTHRFSESGSARATCLVWIYFFQYNGSNRWPRCLVWWLKQYRQRFLSMRATHHAHTAHSRQWLCGGNRCGCRPGHRYLAITGVATYANRGRGG